MRRVSLLALLAVLFLAPLNLFAEVSRADKARIAALRGQLSRAGSLFKGDNFEQSGEIVASIQAEVQKLAADGDKDMLAALKPLHDALGRAHAALEVKGVKIAPLPALGKSDSTKPGAPMPAGGGLSFTKNVAPILVAKCGNCHVRNARGMFSMANYEALMKGNNDGKVLFAGDAKNSRLIEVIESGDMPRGGLKISVAEKATLVKWIDAGAKFDGPDAKANLMSLAPNVDSLLPKIELKRASGNETISFANDIAPVLSKNCANCHGNGRRPSARFNLTNMTAMLRGGESGPAILPGKPEESLLIQKLTSPKSGQRMPLRQPALPAEVIAKIRTWIKEGASFDGPDPNQHVSQVAALAKAKASTHEELSADRVKLADKNWNLGMSDIKADTAESDNFYVLGNIGEQTVADFAKKAEAAAPRVAEIFGAPSDQPLLKGRMTMFLFRQRYDYSEFGKMVEKRELPRGWRGHWRFNIVDAYAAMIPPRAEEYGIEPLVVEHLAGAYIASLGDAPKWFAEGAGRVAASRVDAKDARVVKWDEALPEVLQSMQQSDDFIQGKLPPDAAAIASYSFVKYLMGRDGRRFKQLLSTAKDAGSFEKAFEEVYRTTPANLTKAWAAGAARKGRRRR